MEIMTFLFSQLHYNIAYYQNVTDSFQRKDERLLLPNTI